MDKLTLDTSVVRDWAWCLGYTTDKRYNNDPNVKATLQSSFNQLEALRNCGDCEIAITTQIYTDFDGKSLPVPIQAVLSKYVELATPSLSTNPFVFPRVFAPEQEIRKLFGDIFPGVKWDDSPKGRKDALQLYAHLTAKRDYFITHDKDFHRQQAILLSRWGVQVLYLQDYLQIA